MCEDAVKVKRKLDAEAVGYPQCRTCHCVIKNLRMFEKHMREPHATKRCKLISCSEEVVCGTELQHVIDAHGFSGICPVCEKHLDNYRNFIAHVNTHEVKTPCALCKQMVPQKDQEKHAEQAHHFPACQTCSQTFDTIPLYYYHLRRARGHPRPWRHAREIESVAVGAAAGAE